MRSIGSVISLAFMAVAAACSESGSDDSDGAPGGSAGSGAAPGGSSSGGASGAGAGGSATGGSATGGSATGGSATGGSATGGSAGAAGGMGGSAGSAGSVSGSGGSGGAGGGTGPIVSKAGMNFFVTSRSPGKGGNFGSLAAADAFCDELATAVSADLGAKTWRAYLSTSTVSARDRIGAGPWRNQAGVVVANNVTELHQQEAAQALDATWPPSNLTIALDEQGNQVVNDVHDILTGSNVDGTVATGATCTDWTSQSMADMGQVGHSNRNGGGRPPYFNATHTVGCAPSAANRVQGTVTSGGGRGSIYCFALEPSSGP